MNKQILRLTLPNIITNITIPLLGIVDTAVMGHLKGDLIYTSADYIGAISIGSMIFNFIYWNFGFLRMGTTGFTAQAYGARDLSEIMSIFVRGILISLTIALLLIVIQRPIGSFSIWMTKGSEAVESLALRYFFIRIWAAPATLSLYVFKGWFLGMQNSRSPMFVAILINVLNIVLNLWFVLGLGMGIDGVAWGTVIAQYGGLIASIILWLIYYYRLSVHFNFKMVLKSDRWKGFFMVNRDIFLRTLCLVIVTTYFTIESSAMPQPILAVNTLLLQFFMFFSYMMDGFGYAGEALVGRYIGAKNEPLLHKCVKWLFVWGGILSILFTVIYYFYGESLLKILTSNMAIIEASKDYFYWVLLIPIVSFSAFLWDGIYIGATASQAVRNTMFIALAVFFAVYGLLASFGNHGLWMAFLCYLLVRGIALYVTSSKHIYPRAMRDYEAES